MSFIQSVTGPSFQTGFTFTTNNISVDDISCNTLEANTAVIQDLTTVNFQPIILNTSTLSASAAYIDDIFCQNISSTGIIDAFEINVCNIDIENVSVEKATMTEADVSLLVIKDQTNTKQSEIERDNDILTIAGGYDDGINQYTGDIDLTPYHQGNSSVVSLKVRASDGGVIIPNLESTTLNSNVVNVSYLYVDEVTTYKNAGNAKATILATSNSLQFSSGSNVAQIFSAGVDEYININPTANKTTILNAELDGDTIIEGLVNLSISNDLTCGGNLSVGLQYTQEIIFMSANMANQNSQFISANTQDTYNLLTQDYSIQGNPGIKYLFCDHTLGNTNISNLSVDNLSVNNIVFDNLSFDNLSVTDSFTCNDAQIDDLFNCDMTNSLRGGTSGIDIPFDNISVEFNNGTKDTLVMLKPSIVLYNISLLSDIITLAPPTFEMTTGTAQITNANMSNLSVNNLSVITDITTPSATITNLTVPAGGIFNHDFSQNISAGTGISITQVGNKAVISNTGGSVTDPLNLSKLNVSNISCDEGITTDTLTCDLTPNLTAGAGVSITSVANKPVISAVNSVSANVPVSDFIETLQIVPSGTTAFVNQAAGQGSQLISVYDFQGGTPYTAANMFTVYAGDKIVFNWKQSGWVQNTPQLSYVICYLVKGTSPTPSGSDRIEVGRINQYIFYFGDHEEISGSFVYNVTSTFSFYRSQMEAAPNLVTQGQDYGAATATVYRATVPNSISVPTLIDATNISVVNLSTNLLNNISAGENITLSTEAITNKLVITATGGLNSSNISLDNLSVTDNITTTNLSAVNVSSTELSLTTMRLKDNTQTTRGSWFVYPTAMEIYTQNDFRIRNNGLAGSPNFMVFDTSSNNVNISNLSVSNLDVEFVDLTNNLTAGSNITITSVGGKAEIAWSGGGGVPANLSIDNLSVNFDASIGGALGVGTGVAVAAGNITTLFGNVTANNGSINGNNMSVFNDATITRDLQVQRYLDAGKPTFIMLRRTNDTALTGSGINAVFNSNTTAQINGEFSTSGGTDVIVATGGWYRVSWALGFLRTANTGGDRIAIHSYNMTRTTVGGQFIFVNSKHTIGSSIYIRRNNQCREGNITGYNFCYIPAGGGVRIGLECMVETATSWNSNFSGMTLKNSSNFMVEFVSSAPET